MLRKDFPGADLSTLPAGKEIARQAEGTATFTANNRAMRVYWATAPMAGWKLVLVVPEAIILEPVVQMAWQTLQIGMGGVFLAVVLAAFVARRFSGRFYASAPHPRPCRKANLKISNSPTSSAGRMNSEIWPALLKPWRNASGTGNKRSPSGT
jgi:hypothetical protein